MNFYVFNRISKLLILFRTEYQKYPQNPYLGHNLGTHHRCIQVVFVLRYWRLADELAVAFRLSMITKRVRVRSSGCDGCCSASSPRPRTSSRHSPRSTPEPVGNRPAICGTNFFTRRRYPYDSNQIVMTRANPKVGNWRNSGPEALTSA